MTIGYWLDEAKTALHAAELTMAVGPAETDADADAVAGTRARIYAHLARVMEFLAGGSLLPELAEPRRAARFVRLSLPAPTRLYAGLLVAGGEGQHELRPDPGRGEPAREMRRAADAAAIIGDILASHAVPGQRALTPEGLAMRMGGGVPAGFAAVAELTVAAIALDQRLPAWLGGLGVAAGGNRESAVDAARWAVNSDLFAVAVQVIADADGLPRLLHELDLARRAIDPAPAVTTVDEAGAALAAVRTGLWQRPHEFGVDHLRLAARVGLAIESLTADRDPAVLAAWRGAAGAAANLRGAPAAVAGRAEAAELAEVLRWTRLQQQKVSRPNDRARFSELADQMPLLASTLSRGLRHAVERRHDLLLPDIVLRRSAGSLIYRATERWRPAHSMDDAVKALRRQFDELAAPRLRAYGVDPAEAAKLAALAWVGPSRRGSGSTTQAAGNAVRQPPALPRRHIGDDHGEQPASR